MRSTALRTASAPAPSVLACGFNTYSPEKSGFTSAAKTGLRQRKGTSHYQIRLTVGGSLGFFNKLLERESGLGPNFAARMASRRLSKLTRVPSICRIHFHYGTGECG